MIHIWIGILDLRYSILEQLLVHRFYPNNNALLL